jgi:hypothetical protein
LSNVGESGGVSLTIELRDGSHVIGKGLDDSLSFQSPDMGDLKLSWAGIRSISFPGAGMDVARLTATNGDEYELHFAVPALWGDTSSGNFELLVNLIRYIKASAVGAAGQFPSGLAALWLGDGNANDSIAENDGTLRGGVAFTDSGVGEAFNFDGSTGYVSVPHSPLWDFGARDFSIALWANFISPGGEEALIADDNAVGAGQN